MLEIKRAIWSVPLPLPEGSVISTALVGSQASAALDASMVTAKAVHALAACLRVNMELSPL
ncbi:hypothetical protein GCM10011430_27340 [Oxalicibacterium solurbis]|uniref:Uncharacterized protein n=1 Tax=Oxalicibacterium solurbis TaxID=69280 RepID=A0A8J3B5P7_9BURK|nr:hypothetical protein GCM10011430_27340 [Oxalicibacterium solurbis]